MAPFHIVSCVFTLFCLARADIMTVTFNSPVEITCNDSKVIEIVNMTVGESATDCLHDVCSVTAADKEAIQHQCNGHNSCNMSSNLQTDCLKDHGFYSFYYTCQEILPLSCDFEQDQEHQLCDWTVPEDSVYIWTTGTGESPGYGPDKDHTTGNPYGTYIYTYPVEFNEYTTLLKSDVIQTSRKQCLTFWYNISKNKHCRLSVYLEIYRGSERVDLWSTSTGTDSRWYNQILPLHEVMSYQIVFEAKQDYWSLAYIALDDIVIANKNCYVSEQDCNFEDKMEEPFGSWSTNKNKDYHWRLHNDDTKTSNTGPDFDHTTGLHGTYIYLEASNIAKNTEADLISPYVLPTDEACLTFWYHMFGTQMGALKVFRNNGMTSSEIWSKSGNEKDQWHQAFVNIASSETFYLTFKGIRGRGKRSDIAIDDIYLITQTCEDFKISLSHLTKEPRGESTYSKTCLNLRKSTHIQECSENYMLFIQEKFTIYPAYTECFDVYKRVKEDIELFCDNNILTDFCNLTLLPVLQSHPSCFMMNKLIVEYTCKDNPDLDALKSQESKDTAVTVGVIAVVIILACAVAVLIFVFRRSKHCKKEPKPPTKLQNNTVNLAAAGDYRSDYTGNQDIALSNASGHVIQLAMVKDGDQQYDEIGSIRNEEHTDTDIDRMTAEQTRPQYEYVDSEINGCINRKKQDRSNVNCYPSSKDIESKNNKSHYSFAKEVNLESNITEDYAVLDPNKTGFNRSNVITDVEIDAYNKPDRSKNMENDLTTQLENQYDVSNDGTYDASNNNRHKETENNVYSHTVDSVYDTSSHKRAEQENENAYDHFFEERSADDKA